MQGWEFKLWFIPDALDEEIKQGGGMPNPTPLMDPINKFGKDGWEPMFETLPQFGRYLIFKRPLAKKKTPAKRSAKK